MAAQAQLSFIGQKVIKMKYARIVNNTACDVRTQSPEGCFTPNIVAEFVSVPDNVQDGWAVTDGVWEAPVIPAPYEPTAEEITAQESENKKAKFKADIQVIEMTITPRRTREAILGTDNGWLAEQEAAIAILRAEL